MRLKPSTSIFGIVIAAGIIWVSVMSTTENHFIYLNALGLMLVVGGTLAAAILTYSLSAAGRFLKAFLTVFMRPRDTLPDAINEVIALAAGARADADYLKKALPGIAHPFTKEAVRLVVDGLPVEETRSILRQMVSEALQRETDDAAMFRVISKFPPAFGLMGTLIGLIAMLQGMGGGEDMLKNLGPHMSVALIATFYGILTANMFLIPAAESIEKAADANSKSRMIVASGVLMIAEKTPVILIRERLKAYLDDKERAEIRTPAAGGAASARPRAVAGKER